MYCRYSVKNYFSKILSMFVKIFMENQCLQTSTAKAHNIPFEVMFCIHCNILNF